MKHFVGTPKVAGIESKTDEGHMDMVQFVENENLPESR